MGTVVEGASAPVARLVQYLSARANTNPAMAQYFAARLARNKDAMTLYAASLCGLVALFTILHWTRILSKGLNKSNALLRPVTSFSRLVRRYTLRYMPIFTSGGQFLVVATWLALNIGFTVYNHGGSMTATAIANRTGWLASANMAVVVFLAMKNTPLAILTPYSYERLNGLHRVAGYTTLAHMIVHATVYTNYFLTTSGPAKFTEDHIIAGIILGFAVLFTVLVATFLRRANYELFYIAHVCLFIVISVTFALHQPHLDTILPIALVTAGFWFYDRLIRASRLVYNSINNEARIEPLPNGGTRVILKKPLSGARAGKHCYLWLPKIRSFQTHPFTVVSNNPLELIVGSHDGFTKELHDYAVANPGAILKASAEGPYGTFPDPAKYDKVILVSGGSGATFTHGLAEEMLDKMVTDSEQDINLIWAVREHSHVSWFTKRLDNILTHDKRQQIELKVHITSHETLETPVMAETDAGTAHRTSSSASSTTGASIEILNEKSETSGSTTSTEDEKSKKPIMEYSLSRLSSGDLSSAAAASLSSVRVGVEPSLSRQEKDLESGFSTDVEKPSSAEANAITLSSASTIAPTPHAVPSLRKLDIGPSDLPVPTLALPPSLPLLPGRPDVAAYIKATISSVEPSKRVLVAACGPPLMLKTIRNAAAECVRGDGPSVEVHCEQFGW
ncbi:ferric reductase NAD binding domain-containing protein [Microdochium trichocladiopsis]|uniref:Ferric reductase NAD binding domain-containing protein n=1 Tax=Microdochium trichocladiopsis TaxID=1682393 RepID=A0A9P8Y8R1_9PEZI|nr:ferric reductase NAD binding domain-containing protein [Microdochium trichocladiopsis]KAH7030765.1 ferric reductase NAD binding domain-containing protein [Microdochium trichocladiopsis]